MFNAGFHPDVLVAWIVVLGAACCYCATLTKNRKEKEKKKGKKKEYSLVCLFYAETYSYTQNSEV